MRVMQVLHNFPPEFRGGVERYVEDLSLGLQFRGHKLLVVAGSETSQPSPAIRKETWRGLAVRRILRSPGLHNPVDPFEPQVVPLYEQILKGFAPHVVHLHHWWNLSDDLVRRATALGIPTLVTLHDAFTTCSLFFRLPDQATPCDRRQGADTCPPCLGSRFGVDQAELLFLVKLRQAAFEAELRAACRVLTPSRAHAGLLRPHIPEDVALCPLALGSAPMGPLPPRPSFEPPQPLRLLHFGHLSKLKGVELLVRAVEAVDPRGEHLALTLAGDKVEEDLDFGHASWVPDYTMESLHELVSVHHLALFPSLARESYGLVVDEALRLGLPVAVSDRGALKERIGKRGLVFEGGSQEALERLLRRLLAEPELVGRLAQAPPVQLPDLEDHLCAMLDLYAACREESLPPVELETPLLARLAHFRERMGEVLQVLSTRGGPKEAP